MKQSALPGIETNGPKEVSRSCWIDLASWDSEEGSRGCLAREARRSLRRSLRSWWVQGKRLHLHVNCNEGLAKQLKKQVILQVARIFHA